MKLISVKDYATREKISVQAVYKRINENRLKSKKIGTMIFVIE
jgi:hypothetical protein